MLGTGEVPRRSSTRSGLGARGSGLGIADRDRCVGRQSLPRPLRFFGADSQARPANSSAEPRVPSPEPRHCPTYLYDADTPRLLTTPQHFAYVKIAEGCDYTCAFCIIPTLRGTYRSRTVDSIVREARGARGARRARAAADLAGHDVLRHRSRRARRAGAAAARAERDRRASPGSGCSTSTPRRSPTTCSTAMAECEKVCRYVDLPLQHASAAVLKRMRRPGNRRDLRQAARPDPRPRARRHTPDDLHRRLPRRDRGGLRRARGFVADTRFDHVGVFTYSHEEGTRAFALADDVPAAVKRRRRNALMARQKRIVAAAQTRADRDRGRTC